MDEDTVNVYAIKIGRKVKVSSTINNTKSKKNAFLCEKDGEANVINLRLV